MYKLLFSLVLIVAMSPVCVAQSNAKIFVPHAVPLFTQPVLIALAFVVGIIGAVLIQKRKNIEPD